MNFHDFCQYSEVPNNGTGSNKCRGWMYPKDLIIIGVLIIVGGIFSTTQMTVIMQYLRNYHIFCLLI